MSELLVALRPHHAWRLPTSVLLTALLVSGCYHEEDQATDPYDPPPEPPTQEASPPMPEATACPATHPEPLTWAPETDEEAAAVDGLVGCSDSALTSISLQNGSDSVWVVAEPAGLTWTGGSEVPLDVALFRDTAPSDAGLPVEPGMGANITSPPEGLRLVLSEDASAAWATVQWLEETADDKVEDGFAKALAAGSPSRQSVIECTRAGWDAGEFIASAPLTDDSDKVEALSDALEVAEQASGCGAALALAEEEARRKPPGAAAPVVTGDDLLRVARSPVSTQFDEASKALGVASKIGTGLQVLLR